MNNFELLKYFNIATIKKSSKIAKKTRLWRKIHKSVAIVLGTFMFLSGVTGLLLGWKKQTKLLPKVQVGATVDATDWLPLHKIETIAQNYLHSENLPFSPLSRIDIRPDKGIAKIIYQNNFKELQIDCKTGAILSIATRKSDIIEKIHDGSIIDYLFGNELKWAKLTYTTTLSLGLIIISMSGFILWLNPFRIRKSKDKMV